jgi:hypothetical protein
MVINIAFNRRVLQLLMSRFLFIFILFHFFGAKHEENILLVWSMTHKGKDKKTMHKSLNSNLFAPYGHV